MGLNWFASKSSRLAADMCKHIRKILNAQRDILSPQAVKSMEAALAETKDMLAGGANDELIQKQISKLETAANSWLKPYPNAGIRENVEVVLVARAVAMAIRTFFVQPFKIPTGSMQPTLYGVNSEPNFTRSVNEVDYISGNGLTLNESEQSRLRGEVGRLQKIQKALVI